MLALSYFFYGWVGWSYCLLLLGTTTIAFIGGVAVVHTTTEKSRRVAMALACAGLLALLGWFKYYGFVSVNVDNLTHALGLGRAVPLLQVALPIAISFYTFMALSYVIDIYRRQLQPARPIGPGALPVVLPASARRPDRARRRAAAPATPAPGSDGGRLLAGVVVDHGAGSSRRS